uniref:RING-type E3 ubiquitin transferase n=2 Tax=Cajanus cajan TaxID=3821 RepID=A0A151T093_CAJCA|nr:putative RING-H2 finger protein ATL5G [Cajanus cajan]
MVPASNEAIKTSLKKSTVMVEGEGCSICLEEMDVNDECYTMPCHHGFHPQCIVTWLKTSHMCPLCRFPLPTLKN